MRHYGPLYVMEPMPKSLAPIYFIFYTWLRGGSTWETLLDLGMIHPIGHFVNPPIPKLSKLHRVFENLFNFMRWFLMHMLRWLFY